MSPQLLREVFRQNEAFEQAFGSWGGFGFTGRLRVLGLLGCYLEIIGF